MNYAHYEGRSIPGDGLAGSDPHGEEKAHHSEGAQNWDANTSKASDEKNRVWKMLL